MIYVLLASALWLLSGWAIAFHHLPLARIRTEPKPALTIVALLVWGAVYGPYGLSVLRRH